MWKNETLLAAKAERPQIGQQLEPIDHLGDGVRVFVQAVSK